MDERQWACLFRPGNNPILLRSDHLPPNHHAAMRRCASTVLAEKRKATLRIAHCASNASPLLCDVISQPEESQACIYVR